MEQYIDKSALVAEIERRKDEITFLNEFANGTKFGLKTAIDVINSLEVKEVDLDIQTFAKEMDTVFALPSSETENTEEEPLNWEYAIAKHFFELGLKAQKS